MNKSPRTQTWKSTKIPNLFLLEESGIYYGRVKPKGGKRVRKSFDTRSFEVAKERMREWLLSLQIAEQATAGAWGDVLQPYQAWLHGQKVREEITASTIDYKTELIDNIRRTWDGFDAFDLAQLSEKRLSGWQVAHRTQYSPTRTNGATTVLREMVEIAVKENVLTKAAAAAAPPGLRYVKVRYDYKRLLNNLPEPRQTVQLRDEVYRRCQMAGSRGGWPWRHCEMW